MVPHMAAVHARARIVGAVSGPSLDDTFLCRSRSPSCTCSMSRSAYSSALGYWSDAGRGFVTDMAKGDGACAFPRAHRQRHGGAAFAWSISSLTAASSPSA